MKTFVLVTKALGYVTPDGVSQPAGTAIARVLWDGSTAWTPPTWAKAVADTGQALYTLAVEPATTLASYDFIMRFTSQEQGAIMSADPLWGVKAAAAGTIDVTDPVLLGFLAAAVTAGLITSQRSAQILDLSTASP